MKMPRHDENRASYKTLGKIGAMYDGIITRSTLPGKLTSKPSGQRESSAA